MIPLLFFGQDCTLSKTTDDFTNETKISTGFLSFNEGKSKFLVSMSTSNKEIDFFFSIANREEGWCFDNSSTAIIQFAGTRLKSTSRNTGSMNCQGLFHFTFRNVATTPSALTRLSTHPIESFSFKGSNKQYDFHLRESDREKFMKVVECIIKESKTLLPG
jgi:hypothetical protein